MEYSHEIIIDLPRERVIELFDSVDNMYKWQPGLKKVEPISGVQGQVGAKMSLSYEMGKRKVDMVETITKRNLPDEFAGTYEAKGVYNEVSNTFIDLDGEQTKWITHHVFEFSNFMMKLMGWIMPGAFKKQSFKYMELFKEFAETS